LLLLRCQVKYKDGDAEDLWLGIEHVRLMIQPGEQLQPPDASTLRDVALRYAEQAQLLEQQQQKKKGSSIDTMDVDSSDVEDEVRLPRRCAHLSLQANTAHTGAWLCAQHAAMCLCERLSGHEQRR
jgi:hypothetical protein